jgi:hypothetical protein
VSSEAKPTVAERFFFDTNGYLVLDRFLSHEHTERLLATVLRVAEERRALQETGGRQNGFTHLNGANVRFFYILEDDPAFLEMLDWPPMMAYVTGLLNERPHHHASDAIIEYGPRGRSMGWHQDGHDGAYRNLSCPVPLLQLKVGYYLTDMTVPGRGQLCIIPGSHRARLDPDPEDRNRTDLFPGALGVCAPAGSAILFHNALWHSHGPWTRDDGARIMLYYAYEHPWMIASQEHWGYPKAFYNERLTPAQRKLFHGFLFDPPEARWG